MKTAGVVVTYNRKEELVKNIKAILSQSYVVDRYYIIDNHGSDNTEKLLQEEGILDNKVIEYVYLKENIGGAGGFYTGLKMAYEDGYDYICLMDDDAHTMDDAALMALPEQGLIIPINEIIDKYSQGPAKEAFDKKFPTMRPLTTAEDGNIYWFTRQDRKSVV